MTIELDKKTFDALNYSNRAYLFELTNSPNSLRHRYSVYLESPEGLRPLWPEAREDPGYQVGQAKCLGMIYSKRPKYVAFHFLLSGCGYSKRQEVESLLRRFNPNITLFRLDGGYPDSSF